ncbi:MAG: succinate dehydrogenase assembly factor 2 [Holosporaceae bacterium]
MVQNLETFKKKLLYHAAHRGMREADLVLERLAKAYLPLADQSQCQLFEVFLALEDKRILDILAGKTFCPPRFQTFIQAVSAAPLA